MVHKEGECLHCDIGKLVVSYIQRDKVVDMTKLTANIAQSLVELIMAANQADMQPKLLAFAIKEIGDEFLRHSGATSPVRSATPH